MRLGYSVTIKRQSWKPKLNQTTCSIYPLYFSQYCKWPSFPLRAPLMFFCLLVFNFSSADNSFSSSFCTMENLKTQMFSTSRTLFSQMGQKRSLLTNSSSLLILVSLALHILRWRWEKIGNSALLESCQSVFGSHRALHETCFLPIIPVFTVE